MGFFDTFYIITGIAFLVIPGIIIYKKLENKTNFTAFSRFISISMIYILPIVPISAGGAGLKDKETLIVVLWIVGFFVIITGFVSGFMNYYMIKKNLEENPEALSFVSSLGSTGGYAFYYFLFYGFLLKYFLPIYDDEDNKKYDLPFIITLFEYPFAVYVIELVLYLGHFFNILSETIILKYNLSKFYIVLLIIFQTVLFPLHMTYVFSYIIVLIIAIILLSLIEIIFGILLYIKYERNKTDEKEIASIPETALNDINNDNNGNNNIVASS